MGGIYLYWMRGVVFGNNIRPTKTVEKNEIPDKNINCRKETNLNHIYVDFEITPLLFISLQWIKKKIKCYVRVKVAIT